MTTLLLLAALAQEAGPDRINKLVEELGANEYATRQKATEELRKIGPAAEPALRRALEDKDAERAHRARQLLEELEKKPAPKPDEKPGAPAPPRRSGGFSLHTRDTARGLTFQMHPDGRVELTVPEDDKDTGKKVYKTYKADSMEEFKQKYPEVAKQYNVERFGPVFRVIPDFGGRGDLEKWMEDLRKRFDQDLFKNWNDLDRLFEDFRFRMRSPREPQEAPTPGRAESGGEFGIRVESVSEALAAQLDLKAGEGAHVTEVKPGSLAEKAGLRQHDVVLKLNGAAVADKWEFRRSLKELLGQGFELEILRAGKKQTVPVKTEK
jgi:hypothetical protein